MGTVDLNAIASVREAEDETIRDSRETNQRHDDQHYTDAIPVKTKVFFFLH